MIINTDIEKIITPNSEGAEYYREQGKLQAQKDEIEFLKEMIILKLEGYDGLIYKEIKDRIQAINQSQQINSSDEISDKDISNVDNKSADNIQNKQEDTK